MPPRAISVNVIQKKRKSESKDFGSSAVLLSQFKDHKFISDSDGKKTKFRNLLPYQYQVKAQYDSFPIQIFVAFLILANFVVSACYKYYDPAGDKQKFTDIFKPFEWFFAIAFLIELLFNMYGSFFSYFWIGDLWAWNWFDFLIVVVSLLNLFFPELPGISVCRLFRAFRVVRLFKRVPAMRKMMNGIMKSLPAMGYAFCALILLMGIWAIIGVEFLYDWPKPGSAKYGIYPPGYYFGDFWKAMLSLFQIMTFDSWASGIARDVIYDVPFFIVYFISYVFIGSIIMQNVLIAALLDVYLSGDQDEEDDEPEKTLDGDDADDIGGIRTVMQQVEMVNKDAQSRNDEEEFLDTLSERQLLGNILDRLDELEKKALRKQKAMKDC